MKKFLSAMFVLGFATAAVAGQQADAKQMAAMKAEMSKCMVCKNMVASMDAIGPVKGEVVRLDSGVAMVHHVADASKLPTYRTAMAAVRKAGGECAKLTDEQAKTDLCPMCQGIRAAALKGATITGGDTKDGDILVMVSSDPAVQKDLAALGDKCAMMMAGDMGADAHAGHKH